MTSERLYFNYKNFSVNGEKDCVLKINSVSGNGDLSHSGSYIQSLFKGEDGAYQLKFDLPELCICNGFGAKFRIQGWESVRYIAVGYTKNSSFQHVKIAHVKPGDWLDFECSHHDLLYQIQNGFKEESTSDIKDLRLYIRGVPGHDGATIDVESLSCWHEDSEPVFLNKLLCSHSVPAVSIILEYWRRCFPNFKQQSKEYLENEIWPGYSDISLPWHFKNKLPSELATVNTYKFSWHALHAATILLLYYIDENNTNALMSAREIVSRWLDDSFYAIDDDPKYTWYDHGVADRLLVLSVFWSIAVKVRFDSRFTNRLSYALLRHAQLLSSEAFYSSHQFSRYHNHAWFQDISLIASCLVIKDYPVAEKWMTLATRRLSDQLQKLIVREHGYSVFVENSIGYHKGVQRLIWFAGKLQTCNDGATEFTEIANELDKWSEFFSYPDGRAPAQGDTFRKENPNYLSFSNATQLDPVGKADIVALTQAGYLIAKYTCPTISWFFAMLGTNLNNTHKHHDDLSFVFYMNGVEWFIDPSFYSHEYLQEFPAYLRKACSHNMLSLPARAYSSIATDNRVLLSTSRNNNKVVFDGINNSYPSATIHRRIEIGDDLMNFVIEGTDRYDVIYECISEDETQELGLVHFHLGDGVVADYFSTSADSSSCSYVLRHPACKFGLTLKLSGYFGTPSLLDSQSGLGFMSSIPTKVIQLKISKHDRLVWNLTSNE